MDCRKALAWAVVVAASCGGCVTHEKTTPVAPDAYQALRGNPRENAQVRHNAQAATWVAAGRLHESESINPNQPKINQNAEREEARIAYQKAIELEPNYADAYVALANLYLSQDDPARAVGVYQRALQQNPKLPALWYEASASYARCKDLPGATQCLGKAFELDSENHLYATHYGLALANAGRTDEAVKVMSKVMNPVEANYNVARMMQFVNRPDLSAQYVQVVLNERPTHVGANQLKEQLEGPRMNVPAVAYEGNGGRIQRAASFQGVEP